MITLATLLNELEFETNKDLIYTKLPILAGKINNIILKIEASSSFAEAENYFALLERIQHLISVLKYNREIEIWGSLWNFARDFERIDDEETQYYFFNEIKNGKYPLIDIKNLLD